MDISNLFTQISLVFVLGTALAFVMRSLRQPPIIGHILTGLIAGPIALNIIRDKEGFEVFSTLGVALLLFIVGLELSVKIISRLGRVVFITTVSQISVIVAISAAVARLLDFGRLESVLIGVCLAMSSTIIIISLIHNKKETTRLYAQIAIGILLLQDVVATLAKVLLAGKGQSGSLSQIGGLALKGALLCLILFILSAYVLPRISKQIQSSKDFLLVFSLGWALGFGVLFTWAGFSVEIGALLAGVSLASLPMAKEMSSRLRPLRDFFIIIFFITLGQALVITDIGQFVVPIVLFSLIVVLVKPLAVLLTLGVIGYTKRASFKTAASLSQVSEFSLVFIFAAVQGNYVRPEIQTIISIIALVSFAVSAYLIKYDDELYDLTARHFKLFERHFNGSDRKGISVHYPVIIFGYRKGGAEFIRTFNAMNKRFAVVDYDPEAIESLERQNISYYYGDAADTELLEEVNLEKAKLVVSTIGDFETNEFIASWLEAHNREAAFIASADSADQAAQLYELGAAYVMIPHFVGSEKMSNFLKRSGFKKSEFRKFREKHLLYLESHYFKPEEAQNS